MPSQLRKPLFDTVRQILGRGFRQSEVDAIDTAIDNSIGAESSNPNSDAHSDALETPLEVSVPKVSSRSKAKRISPAGIAIIKRFEGCARLRTDKQVEAYPDPGTGGEPWTIGWGATGHDLDGSGRIGPGTVWTQAQCDARLEQDLIRYAEGVARAIGAAPTTQNQFDAMVSFHYNTGAIARATLTKKHIGGDFEGAAREFARWNRAGGRVLKGLTRRRAAEAKLYRG